MIDYSIAGTVATVRLDNPPLNVLTFDLLDGLTGAIDRANSDPAVTGIVITGSAAHFTAGADVNIFRTIASDGEAMAVSERFQKSFDRIEQSCKPVAAAVAGSVMGGALECALAAHFRICTAGSRLGMPEVNLGILPGAGGTQRLPRTIGTGAALRLLLSGSPVSAQEAQNLGLVDKVCEPADLLAAACRRLDSVGIIRCCSQRTDTIADAEANEAAFSQAGKKLLRVPRELIASSVIIDAVRTGIEVSFEAGLEKERQGFARCMGTTATRNKIYLFFESRATAKLKEFESVTPDAISSTAVIGMGSMGAGIAQAFAAAGKTVTAIDVSIDAARKGLSRIDESLDRKVERGSLTRQKADALLDRIAPASDIAAATGADLIIEAVFEDIAVKQEIIEKIDTIATPATIVASNTSTINLDLLAGRLSHSERLIGLHFFNPAHSMPLVEVIRRPQTDPQVVATTMNLAKELRKIPVPVNNHVGFVVNRLFIPYCVEAYQLLDGGADAHAIDAAMVAFGFPMGPLSIIDMTGIDILAFTNEIMTGTYPYHIPLSPVATTLVEEGMLGQKTGCGVFRYEKGSRQPLKNERTEALAEQFLRDSGSAPTVFGNDEITDRLVMRLVAEGFRVMEEQVALREADIDVAMVLGTGFPDYKGGVIKYARELGIKKVFSLLESLAGQYGERYQPCNYLQSII